MLDAIDGLRRNARGVFAVREGTGLRFSGHIYMCVMCDYGVSPVEEERREPEMGGTGL